MIKVFLCDDIPLQLCMLEDLVKEYFAERGFPADIQKFESGERLLEYVDKNGPATVYLLDMILPGIKGIGIGRELRARGDNGKIIYVTSTSEYAVDSYFVDAFFYLLKPIGKKVLYAVLDKVFAEIVTSIVHPSDSTVNQHFEIKTRSGKTLINTANLEYIDIVDRSLCWHMTDGTEYLGPMLRAPFAQAIGALAEGPSFLCAGTHLVVNLACITTIDKTSVTFKDGTTIYPSKNACNMLYDKIKSLI